MNKPPTDGIRVDAAVLRKLVEAIFTKLTLPAQHAAVIAELLVDTDLRGVVSHGVQSVDRYVLEFQGGELNSHPQVQLLRQGPVTAAYSGDGGLGIIVANEAMRWVIGTASRMGIAVATATYHGHAGSMGKYVRQAMRQNLIGISFTGRNAAREYDKESNVFGTFQGSPAVAFGIPSGPQQPDFLFDTATHVHFDEQMFAKQPELFFRSLGIGHVGNILSGTLGGQMLPQFDSCMVKYPRASQSSFFLAIDPEQFVPIEAFKSDLDHLMDQVSKMTPLPGYRESTLPGGPEWKCDRDYAVNGVPISAQTLKAIEHWAREYGEPIPW